VNAWLSRRQKRSALEQSGKARSFYSSALLNC
jgi:hypothetical protein